MQPIQERDLAFVYLAEFLLAHKNEIIDRWVEAARTDPAIASSEKLTNLQMIDHLPDIIDEICVLLKDRRNQQVNEEVLLRACIHGHYRWQQGFRLDELIREMQTARKIILAEYLPAFSAQQPAVALAIKSEV